MGLTIQEYKEKTKGQRRWGDLSQQEKIDLLGKTNMQNTMKGIAKRVIEMAGPIYQLNIKQGITNQLAGPILQFSTYYYEYVKSTNQKRAYFSALRGNDKILDVWLSEHNEDYPYALEEGKLYRYGARKGAMICEVMAVIPTISIEGLEHCLSRYVERKYGKKSIRAYLLRDYWGSKLCRDAGVMLVDGRSIEDTSAIEDIDNLISEAEYIALKYLRGFRKLPEQRRRQFLLYGMGVKKYLYQICGNKNRATVAMRTARRRMEEEEYQKFLEGIEKLRALTLELGREEKIIIGYLICLICDLPLKIVTFF